MSDIDIAFPATTKDLMPPYEDLPEEFTGYNGRWQDVAETWFFKGLDPTLLIPKEGIDKTKAIRHLKCIMGSFEPKHQHKIAGAAYLMSMWFV